MTDLTYSDKADPERTGLYLYGVVPSKGSNGEPLVVAEPGLDGAAVQVVASGDIGILTHACAPVPYEGGVAQIHAWVLAQHEVIKSAHAQAGTILPIRFNSIVAATDRGAAQILVDWLERCHDELAAQLDALRDRVELGVQLFAGRVPTGATADADSEATGSVSRGRGYFQAQLAARQERERSRAAEALTAQTVFDDLTRLCEEIVVNPKRPAREGVQSAEAGQSGQRMLLD
ncbi:MAG: GvpL/GvpF family gas vesicle protein, partial [Actinomycetes bacterium]